MPRGRGKKASDLATLRAERKYYEIIKEVIFNQENQTPDAIDEKSARVPSASTLPFATPPPPSDYMIRQGKENERFIGRNLTQEQLKEMRKRTINIFHPLIVHAVRRLNKSRKKHKLQRQLICFQDPYELQSMYEDTKLFYGYHHEVIRFGVLWGFIHSPRDINHETMEKVVKARQLGELHDRYQKLYDRISQQVDVIENQMTNRNMEKEIGKVRDLILKLEDAVKLFL